VKGGARHGFVRDSDGTITSFDPGGSGFTVGITNNRLGMIVGTYESGGHFHGYIRGVDGTFSIFDVQASPNGTYGQGINTSGAVVGYSEDENNVAHGFVRTSDGTIAAFDPSGSISTIGYYINRRGAIAGFYQDGNGITHGFVRTP
jgi:probable HAF family extracellular repeat protein